MPRNSSVLSKNEASVFGWLIETGKSSVGVYEEYPYKCIEFDRIPYSKP